MQEAIVVAPDLPESPSVVPETCEPLEFLRELIGDGLQRNDTLFRAASNELVSLLENNVRIGFYISDAKAYLAKGSS
jgi:hypothetical protein